MKEEKRRLGAVDADDPRVREKLGSFSGLMGILANVLLFAGKLTIGALSGSVAITADALNNLSDAGSSVMTFLGFKLAGKPADRHHPFGHARYEYLAGLAVAALIVLIGFELAKSSVEKILHPQAVAVSWALVLVLGLSIVVKLGLWWMNRRLGRFLQSGALLATAADSRNDCIATGAVLLTTLIAHFTHVRLDGWAGLGVAVFILFSGANAASQTISPLLGEATDPKLRDRILECLRSNDKILGYHDLMVHDYGPGQQFASVHVEMDMKEDPLVCHGIIDDVERMCLERHRIHLVIHYDPVVTDDAELNEMRRQVEVVLRSIHPDISIHDFRMVRGETHSNLIFDMILPPELEKQGLHVQNQLETAINLTGKKYYTVITFDSPAFN